MLTDDHKWMLHDQPERPSLVCVDIPWSHDPLYPAIYLRVRIEIGRNKKTCGENIPEKKSFKCSVGSRRDSTGQSRIYLKAYNYVCMHHCLAVLNEMIDISCTNLTTLKSLELSPSDVDI